MDDGSTVGTRDDAGAGDGSVPACHSRRAWGLLLATLVIGLAVDLSAKHWSFTNVAPAPVELDRERLVEEPGHDPVPDHDPHVVLPRVLNFRLAINRGAVFGLGENQRQFFIVFTLIALLGGVYVFRRMTAADAWSAHVAVGLVMAGGLGNLFDRVAYGAVRDFIQLFPGYHLPSGRTWPGGNPEMFPWVFNPADVFLLVGMVVLMIYLNRRKKERREEAAMAETAGVAV